MLMKNGISFSRKFGQESLDLSLSRASCTQGSSPSLCRKLCVAGRELSPWLCSRAISSCVCVREREREKERECHLQNQCNTHTLLLCFLRIPYYLRLIPYYLLHTSLQHHCNTHTLLPAFYSYLITCCSYLITTPL